MKQTQQIYSFVSTSLIVQGDRALTFRCTWLVVAAKIASCNSLQNHIVSFDIFSNLFVHDFRRRQSQWLKRAYKYMRRTEEFESVLDNATTSFDRSTMKVITVIFVIVGVVIMGADKIFAGRIFDWSIHELYCSTLNYNFPIQTQRWIAMDRYNTFRHKPQCVHQCAMTAVSIVTMSLLVVFVIRVIYWISRETKEVVVFADFIVRKQHRQILMFYYW